MGPPLRPGRVGASSVRGWRLSGYEFAPSIWFPLLSAALNGALCVYLWRRRRLTGALPLSLAMLVVTAWCLADAGQAAATDPTVKEQWFLVTDALALPGVTISLWFALEYAGLERRLTRPIATILVAAVVALGPLYVVDGGRLLWTRLWWDGAVRGDLGPVGMAYVVWGLGISLASTAVLLLLFVRSPAHRVPVILILVGQVSLRVVYPLGTLNMADLPGLPAMVFAFDFTSIMYMLALFRFRLFDVVPVAHQAILQRMPDALIVLDAQDRIADLNAAAERLLDLPRSVALRQPASTAFGRLPDLVPWMTGPATVATETTVETEGTTRAYEVSATSLADWQGRPIGRLVQLHEITALRHVEAQLVERERALASAAERERMARELHDGLAQDLWLAKLKTSRLAGLPGLASEARVLTAEVTAAVDAGLAEARHAVAAMRNSGSAVRSLCDLLKGSLDDFEDRFGLGVELECDAKLPTLPPRAEAEILRIVHEALTNIRRHADATVVRVRASADDGSIVLEVRDNGRGFDPGAAREAAYGLAGMRERAALLGGELWIESAPSKGTLVRVRVPLLAAPSSATGPLGASEASAASAAPEPVEAGAG